MNHSSRIRWALAVAVALIVILFYQLDMFERLELLTLDYRFKLRPQKPSISDVVFIDMAEDSIRAIGSWPWPRSWHATLIKALSDQKPKAIVFDVLFSEPQNDLDDGALEEAMRQSGVVYLPLLFDLNKQEQSSLYKGVGVVSVVEPLPRFAEYARGEGHINAIPDIDGVLRRIPPVISFKDTKRYQLGLKVGLDLSGVTDAGISFDPAAHVMTARLPDNKLLRIPLDNKNQLIINWKGKWGKEFAHFSYIDVIRSYAMMRKGEKPKINLGQFKDKICVIGLTASGLIDIKPMPLENAYPAVGVNAMVISSIMNRDFIYEAPKKYNILLILLVSVLVTLSLSNLRLMGGIALTAIGIICYVIFSVAAFDIFNIAVATFYPILAIFMSYGAASLYAQILQSVERARLFSQATHDGLTGLYNIHHFNLLLEGEFRNVSMYKARRLTLAMIDIDNFKHLNDTYGHPAGDAVLKEFARIIQSKCRQTDVAARYGGEEFILMLSGAGKIEAVDIAEDIRDAIEKKRFQFGQDNCGTTVSIGIAEFAGEPSRKELIEKADRALYRAKNEGKNRTCIS